MARNSRGRRPDYEWFGTSIAQSISSGSSTVDVILTAGSALTVVRLRGSLVCSIDGPVDGDKVQVGYGIIVVSEEQVAIGTGAISNPGDAGDFDVLWQWMGYTPFLS